MEEETKKKHEDIDGGYAWVILTSAFLAFGLGNGFRQVFGILYPEILERYQAGQLQTSWIITIQVLHWGLMGTKFFITFMFFLFYLLFFLPTTYVLRGEVMFQQLFFCPRGVPTASPLDQVGR